MQKHNHTQKYICIHNMYKQRNILELGLTFFLFSSRQGLGLVEESISPSCPCLFTSPPASFPSRSGFVNCLFFCPGRPTAFHLPCHCSLHHLSRRSSSTEYGLTSFFLHFNHRTLMVCFLKCSPAVCLCNYEAGCTRPVYKSTG